MIIDEICNDVFLIDLETHSDERGFFLETYNKNQLSKIGFDINFIQDNLSFSLKKNTIRGLHFQKPPFNQKKLITVLQGSIFDVFIDVRKSSKNFGTHNFVILDNPNQALLISEGFIHGFCTLEDNTLVSYKVDKEYNMKSESGVIWNDEDIGINWPLNGSKPILSNKDENLQSWDSFINELEKK